MPVTVVGDSSQRRGRMVDSVLVGLLLISTGTCLLAVAIKALVPALAPQSRALIAQIAVIAVGLLGLGTLLVRLTLRRSEHRTDPRGD